MRHGEKAFLKIAAEAAFLAGKLLLRRYGKLKQSQIQVKSRHDFVTEVDCESQRLIISTIQKYFPDHHFYAEEGEKESMPDHGVLWVIDPLDGTANYIHRFPLFSISIGVLVDGKPRTGVIYDPVHREMFTAQKGKGAFLNGKRISVAKTKALEDALMATGIPFRARDRFEEYMASFRRISLASAGMRRGGSAALDLAYVACGRLDGFWELDLALWDIAAGALLIEEAGGRVTDVWGGKEHWVRGDILAANSFVHEELLRITSKCLIKRKGCCEAVPSRTQRSRKGA
ncbi:MAG: inositol monophosphatase [Candidatus Omnitrophica bacterium]|nr:inositol monophosphatase [Candidatus Omnitrophota bacterium]